MSKFGWYKLSGTGFRMRSLAPALGAWRSFAMRLYSKFKKYAPLSSLKAGPKHDAPQLPADMAQSGSDNGFENPSQHSPSEHRQKSPNEDAQNVNHHDACIRAILTDFLHLPRSVLVSSFFINLLGLALPLVILQVYDRILPNQSYGTLAYLMLGLLGVIFLEAMMKVARAYVMGWISAQESFRTEIDAVSRILHSRAQRIEQESSTQWIDRLDALTELNQIYGGPSRLIILDLPFVLIFLTVTFLVGGIIVLIPIAVIALFACYIVHQSQTLGDLLQSRYQQDGRRYDFIVECLNGIQTIKSMAMEPQMQRRFERLQKNAASVSYDTILYGNHMQSVGNLFANVTMIAIVSVGAFAVMDGSMSIGALACCTLLSGRVIQPILRAIGMWSETQNMAIAYERAEQIFNLPEPVFSEEQQFEDIKGRITLRGVGLRSENGNRQLFQDISLNIAPGSIIGLRGKDGSGKSSLVKMIRGEIAAESGSAFIDGHNVNSDNYKKIRKSICYVSEGGTVFQGTILENLTMFRMGAAIEDARKAAQLIGLEKVINRLPDGYDTVLGDGVVESLPMGLIQRIAITRALTQKPKILLFDEANTALDQESDRLLREGLSQLKGEMTILLISNRPSLLNIASHIYELRDGALSETTSDGTLISEVNSANTPDKTA